MTQLGAPLIPKGDMGLGLCFQCSRALIMQVQAHARDPKAKPPAWIRPAFAVVLSPLAWPIASPGGGVQGVGLVAAPACFDCLLGTSPAAQLAAQGGGGSPLLVATGRVP